MDKHEFEKRKEEMNRNRNIYALKSKIEDYEFRLVEMDFDASKIRKELEKCRISLEKLEQQC